MTKLYYHQALSGLSNLPTTNQSALTPATPVQYPSDSFTDNRTMDRNKGIATTEYQTCGNDSSAALRSYYFCKFASEPLLAQTIAANTWNYNFGARVNSTIINYPCSGANQPVYVCVYVWRPGSGKVFTIYEGNSSATADEPSAANTGYSEHVTFSGTSGTVQDDDVIIQEIWFRIDPSSYQAGVQMVFIFDGNAADITTSGTSIGSSLNYAGFLETPQTLLFEGDVTPPVNATSDWKDILKQRPQQLITNSI